MPKILTESAYQNLVAEWQNKLQHAEQQRPEAELKLKQGLAKVHQEAEQKTQQNWRAEQQKDAQIVALQQALEDMKQSIRRAREDARNAKCVLPG